MAPGNYSVDGPWGGDGGAEWTDGTYSDITRIVVRVGDIIDAIQVQYRLRGVADPIDAPLHGSATGDVKPPIVFEPGEYLKQIEGVEGQYNGKKVVQSLTFFTANNKTNIDKQYGPYGTGAQDATAFKSNGHGKIVGFYGRSGDHVNRIGVYTFSF